MPREAASAQQIELPHDTGVIQSAIENAYRAFASPPTSGKRSTTTALGHRGTTQRRARRRDARKGLDSRRQFRGDAAARGDRRPILITYFASAIFRSRTTQPQGGPRGAAIRTSACRRFTALASRGAEVLPHGGARTRGPAQRIARNNRTRRTDAKANGANRPRLTRRAQGRRRRVRHDARSLAMCNSLEFWQNAASPPAAKPRLPRRQARLLHAALAERARRLSSRSPASASTRGSKAAVACGGCDDEARRRALKKQMSYSPRDVGAPPWQAHAR